MIYQQQIAKIVPNVPAAEVEAWMRLEHNTLGALSPSRFRSAALMAAECAKADPALSQRLRASYGL
jgi:EAL domain-containing protein (putative c-di-GMP-specific phosphodiesterase class I)